MLCGGQFSLRLLRFNTASGRWQEELPGGSRPEMPRPSEGAGYYLGRLPNYQGALIQTASGDAIAGGRELWRTHLWQDGAMRLLTEDPRTHYYLPPNIQPPDQPAERYLAFFVPGDANGGQGFSALGLDMEACESDPCELEPLPGMPGWSPDGRHTLVIMAEADGVSTLQFGDDRGRPVELIGRGQSPAWLDESRFTYIPLDPGRARDEFGRTFGQQVMLATANGQDGARLSTEMLFDAEMVRQAIPEGSRPETLGLWTAEPALNGDEWWFVGASSPGEADSQDFVAVFNPQSGEARIIADLGRYRLIQSPMISPQRGYAIIGGLSPDGNDISVELLDAATGELRRLESFFPTDWSADDEWLIQIESGTLTLTSTATGQQWPIEHDLPGCYSAVWTDR